MPKFSPCQLSDATQPPRRAFVDRSLVRRVVGEMAPLTLVNVLALALTTIDSVFLAQKYGHNVDAMFGPTTYIALTFGCLISGATLAVKIRIARLFAAPKDAANLRSAVATSFCVVAVSAAALIALWFAVSNLLISNALPPESRPYANAYLNAYFLACFVPSALYECAAKTLLALKRPRVPLLCAALAGALNVALTWLFLFPLDKGVAYSAYATALATGAAAALAFAFLRSTLASVSPSSKKRERTPDTRPSSRRLTLQSRLPRSRRLPFPFPRFDGATARFLLQQGGFLALDNLLFNLATLCLYRELNQFCATSYSDSDFALAAAGISVANRLEAWVHNLQNAGSETTSTAVAHYSVSAPERVRQAVAYCALLTVALSATLALTLYVGRDWALEFYKIKKGTLAYDAAILRLSYMTSTYWLCGVAGVLAHARRATGRSKFVFGVAIVSALSRLAWIYLVSNYWENQELHHYLSAYPVSWLVGIVLLLLGGRLVDAAPAAPKNAESADNDVA